MKEISNFSKFKWEFVPNEFYFVQIIQRWKDWHPNLKKNDERVIRSYFIDDPTKLWKVIPEMIKLAKDFKARVYVNPVRRSWDKLGIWLIWYVAAVLQQDSKWWKKIKSSVDHVAWVMQGWPRHYIIDCDYDKISEKWIEELVKELWDSVLNVLDTPNGKHILASTFDTRITQAKKLDVKRNWLTVLYSFI